MLVSKMLEVQGRKGGRPRKMSLDLRYGFINRAGLLVQSGGRQTLDAGNNPMVQARFKTVENSLAA